MFRKLLPKEVGFFDFFENHNALIIEACRYLQELSKTDADIASISSKIKEIESRADKITYQCISALHRTFITPFDRDQIHRLIRRLDDILDLIEEASMCINMYEIKRIKREAQEYFRLLLSASLNIGEALKSLRHIRNPKPIIERCAFVAELEQAGDYIIHSAMARLFKEENDPFTLIKWKEILELLEKALDKCHDAANTIEGIVIEAS
jgi:uncharacterized protein Yka (UPF0111/DUF47 family)